MHTGTERRRPARVTGSAGNSQSEFVAKSATPTGDRAFIDEVGDSPFRGSAEHDVERASPAERP